MLEEKLIKIVRQLIVALWLFSICVAGLLLFLTASVLGVIHAEPGNDVAAKASLERISSLEEKEMWIAPDTAFIPTTPEGDLIRYGRDLIAHTSLYLGPGGSVSAISNGMNCQNCHLKAGTVPFGNNYGAVASTYPKLRHRSGTVEGFEKRINDCIERSLNGKKLAESSREMSAMVAYINWLGKDVPKGKIPKGAGLLKVPYLDRAASPLKGKLVYDQHCSGCHGNKGEGVLADNGREWLYPPLYGQSSYNTGAGLFRLSRFAAFVKANMPYGVSFENPVLSDEEAWDVAAFINSMPRPVKDAAGDWPDISKKPIDHPFGPYADDFSEEQHKYGPFESIELAKERWK